jgi:CRP/FNR family transcriptional regulator
MFSRKFAQLPIFNDFTDHELELLDSLMEMAPCDPNQVIFEQGSSANFLYILLEGEVSIYFKPYDGPPITVANIHPGGVFGWSAIVGRETYTSKANSIQPGLTYRIHAQNVTLLCKQHPEIGEKFIGKLMSGIDERINTSHNQMRDSLSQGKQIIDMYIGSVVKNG